MKILVTGLGYIGSVICKDLLDLGYNVRGVDNFHKGNIDYIIPYCSNERFEFMYGDITNIKDVRKIVNGVDAIIHTAAIVGFPACAKNPKLSYNVNVEGTKNLVDSTKPHTPMFFTSTGSVYGKIEGVCTEETPLNPQSEYGEQKAEAEAYFLSKPNNTAYRFATAFGVSPSLRVNLLINDLTFSAYTNKSLVIFEADARRTFIHIKDFSNSIMFWLKHHNTFKYNMYNVGHPECNWTKRQVAEKIKEKVGCHNVYAEVGKDRDTRDYDTNYSRFLAEGWKPRYDIEYGINEVLKVCPLLQMRNPYS